VIEQALETAPLMLGKNKSSVYCLEMISCRGKSGERKSGNTAAVHQAILQVPTRASKNTHF
jgi:hypothetical protein